MISGRVLIELEVPYALDTLFADRKISGVYIIQNVFSDRCYVGAASNVAQRWRAHYLQLMKGQHRSGALQSDFSDIPDLLVFRLLEMCPVSELNDREVYHAAGHEDPSTEWGYSQRPHRYPTKQRTRK